MDRRWRRRYGRDAVYSRQCHKVSPEAKAAQVQSRLSAPEKKLPEQLRETQSSVSFGQHTFFCTGVFTRTGQIWGSKRLLKSIAGLKMGIVSTGSQYARSARLKTEKPPGFPRKALVIDARCYLLLVCAFL